MKKINIMEVNNIDLAGRRFNGYDMTLDNLFSDKIEVKMASVIKQSSNKKVKEIIKDDLLNVYYKLQKFEEKNSVHNIFSITSPALMKLREYNEADIIHFHMFHNSKFSLYSLLKISKEKKVVMSLHDPWFLTGRCVHFYECNKWLNGCNGCKYLDNMFPFKEDNCSTMWKIKKMIFDKINIDIVVSSKWMLDLVKKSPIFYKIKNIHYIPFGIDLEKFKLTNYENARKKYNIKDDEVVLFLRAQNEFKGTQHVMEALKNIKIDKKVTILTCENKGLFKDLASTYKIIDLGYIEEDEAINAFNACDIFLMPSKAESFGMMAIEAMATSKPVIIFDNSALPSVTHSPECGYSVKNGSSEDLGKAIKFLVENKDERIKRGKLGRKICEQEYDVKNYNDLIKNMYEKVYYTENSNIANEILSGGEESTDYNLKFLCNSITKKIVKSHEQHEILYNLNTSDIKKKINFSDEKTLAFIDEYNNKLYSKLHKKNVLKNNSIFYIKQLLKKNKKLYEVLKKSLRRKKYEK